MVVEMNNSMNWINLKIAEWMNLWINESKNKWHDRNWWMNAWISVTEWMNVNMNEWKNGMNETNDMKWNKTKWNGRIGMN